MNADILSAAEGIEDDPAERLDDALPPRSPLDRVIDEAWRRIGAARMTPDAIARILFAPPTRATLLTNPRFQFIVDAAPTAPERGERLFGIPIETRSWMPPDQAALVSPCGCHPSEQAEENHFIKRHVVIIKGI